MGHLSLTITLSSQVMGQVSPFLRTPLPPSMKGGQELLLGTLVGLTRRHSFKPLSQVPGM